MSIEIVKRESILDVGPRYFIRGTKPGHLTHVAGDVAAEIERLQACERALEGLTPGGSEFVNAPERCASFVRDRLDTAGAIAAERNNLRRALEIAETALDAAAEKFQRIQWIALPGTMIMARAGDGEQEAIDALAAVVAAKGGGA